MSLSISKRNLWHYVNLKISRIIHHYHVFAVISILFEEMIKDLIEEKAIKIANFGVLELKTTPPRLYHNVLLRQMVMGKSHRILRFSLASRVRNKLVQFLDLDKTFNRS